MEAHIGTSIYAKIKLMFDKNINKNQSQEYKLFIAPIIVFKVLA